MRFAFFGSFMPTADHEQAPFEEVRRMAARQGSFHELIGANWAVSEELSL
jgi:hypothetical protein